MALRCRSACPRPLACVASLAALLALLAAAPQPGAGAPLVLCAAPALNRAPRRATRILRRSGERQLTLQEAYAELGLPAGASIRQVRKAFRRLARQLHPDVCAPSELAQTALRFVAMKQAYDFIMSYD
ncbi:unnamed protein product [Durusdinium trenchii]|uniref:J domain-containing protein n=1 Tax=Durusdinium trenchii TaxID=1381693 RepID=A0ABP0MZN2_9DINO